MKFVLAARLLFWMDLFRQGTPCPCPCLSTTIHARIFEYHSRA